MYSMMTENRPPSLETKDTKGSGLGLPKQTMRIVSKVKRSTKTLRREIQESEDVRSEVRILGSAKRYRSQHLN